MIGSLNGIVTRKNVDKFILNVGGVGYLIFSPLGFINSLTENQKVEVMVHTHVREDMITLFGFENDKQLSMFEKLLSVSGIGPKTAMLVMDRGTDAIHEAIMGADVSFFQGIPRLGKKNAQRIIIELKSKLGSISDLDLGASDVETQEVVEALTTLGFTKGEIMEALRQLSNKKMSVEEKITVAFKILGKSKV